MVGCQRTLFFIDIQVGPKFVSALLNTNLSTSKIDFAVLNQLTEDNRYRFNGAKNTTPLPIKRNGIRQFTLDCEYLDMGEVLRIELGMDYFTKTKPILDIDGLNPVPLLYGEVSYKKEARYIIFVRIHGKEFEAVIDIATAESTIDIDILTHEDEFQKRYQFLKNGTNVQMQWQQKEIKAFFKVIIPKNGQRIVLGTNFLKTQNFTMRLNGIKLSINSPWKGRHPDAIDFAYNYDCGDKLRAIERAYGRGYEVNYIRPILPKPDIKKQD